MAAAAILNLLPVAIFDIQPTFNCWSQPPHKISCQYPGRWPTYCSFLKFKVAAVRHLGWFLTNGWSCAAAFPSWNQIWCKNVDRHPNYGPKKRNSKWRPPTSWIYFRLLSLTYSRLSTVDLNHHTKFRANISQSAATVIFQNSRWRPFAILDFWKPDFWPMGGLGLLIFHHETNRCTNYGPKTKFKWRPPPSWIYFPLLFLT